MNKFTVIVLDKININSELKNFITMLENRMLTQLRTSLCKITGINKKEEAKIYSLSDVDVSEIKSTTTDYPAMGKVITDPLYNVLLLIAVKAEKIGDEQFAKRAAMTLGLLMVARLKFKYVQYCNLDVMESVMNGLSRKTYIGSHGIIWAVHKITLDTYNRFKNDIINSPNDPFWRSRCLIVIRHKFNQFVKRIAKIYYTNVKLGDINKENETKFRKISETLLSEIISENFQTPVINYMSKITGLSDDVFYNLQYTLQIDLTFRDVILPILISVIRKINSIKETYDSQNLDLEIDSEIFIRKLYMSYKKTNEFKQLSNVEIIQKRGFISEAIYGFVIVAVCTKINPNALSSESIDDELKYKGYDS